MVRRVLWTEESPVAATDSCVISILDSLRKLTKISPRLCLQLLHSTVGFSFVHSIVGPVTVASYIQNWLFVSRGCGYVRANHSTGLLYNKFIITIVELDTWETSLVHCLRYCYSCFALVTIFGNELVIFPGIAFYYGNNYIVFWPGQLSDHQILHLAPVLPRCVQ